MIPLPKIDDDARSFFIFGMIVVVAGSLAYSSIKHGDTNGAAAWSTLLMAIVGAIKERWQGRTIDRMGQSLNTSVPAPDPVASATIEGEAKK